MKKTLILTAIIVLSCLAATGCVREACTLPGGQHTWNPWEDRLREDGTARENGCFQIMQLRRCSVCGLVERGNH